MKSEEVRNKIKSLLEELTNDAYSGNELQAFFAVKNVAHEWIASKKHNNV